MEITRVTEAFLDAIGLELARVLSNGSPKQANVSWHPAEPGSSFEDLHWWSAGFREGEDWIFTGADADTWIELASDAAVGREDNISVMGVCIETVLTRELGPGKVSNQDVGPVAVFPEGTSVIFDIHRDGAAHSLFFVLNAGLETALAENEEAKAAGTQTQAQAQTQVPQRTEKPAVPGTSLDMLMHVEVPVSVSFGSTRVRMRDLLGLTSGSVVELDQSLGAHVDIRVNECLIARGEVVAVDGNYAVRVLEIVSPQYASAVNGSTK